MCIFLLRQLLASTGIFLLHYASGTLYTILNVVMAELEDSKEAKWIMTTATLAACAGHFMSGFGADIFGRKKTLCASALPAICGCILLFLSQNYWQIIIAAAISGLGTGGLVLSQVYLAEICSSKHRGFIIAFAVAAANFGQDLTMIAIEKFEFNWKCLALYNIAPIFIFSATSFTIPESPLWFASKNEFVQCRKNLRLLKDNNEFLEESQKLIKKHGIEFSDKSIICRRFSVIFSGPFLKSLYISFICFIILELNNKTILLKDGLNYVAGMTGFPETSLRNLTFIISMLGSCLSLIIIRSFKRRSLLLTTGIIALVSSTLFCSSSYSIFKGQFDTSLGWLPLVTFVLHVGVFDTVLIPVLVLINSEVFPIYSRGLGISFSSIGHFIIVLMISITYPNLLEINNFHGVFAILCIVTLLGFAFVYCFTPETGNRMLTAIDDDLHQNNSFYCSVDESRLAYFPCPHNMLELRH